MYLRSGNLAFLLGVIHTVIKFEAFDTSKIQWVQKVQIIVFMLQVLVGRCTTVGRFYLVPEDTIRAVTIDVSAERANGTT